jgi:hypothetical protein
LQPIEPVNIKLIRLIDHAHHQLCLAGVDKLGLQARKLDLVHDPVPVARRFHSNRGAWLSAAKAPQDRSMGMLDTQLYRFTGLNIFSFH